MGEKEQLNRVAEVFDSWAESGRAEGMEKGHVPTARQAYERLALKAGQRFPASTATNGRRCRLYSKYSSGVTFLASMYSQLQSPTFRSSV